jgi:hypothetical protein
MPRYEATGANASGVLYAGAFTLEETEILAHG